jgi:UDP-N-acetylglucosamine 4-epimerase
VGNLLAGEPCQINGDGESSRDFTYIDNVVQANLLAATVEGEGVTDQVYNVAVGGRTTLNELFQMIRDGLAEHRSKLASAEPMYGEFRAGDVRHSLADISKIRARLGYAPTQPVERGLREALDWYASEPGSGRSMELLTGNVSVKA